MADAYSSDVYSKINAQSRALFPQSSKTGEGNDRVVGVNTGNEATFLKPRHYSCEGQDRGRATGEGSHVGGEEHERRRSRTDDALVLVCTQMSILLVSSIIPFFFLI